MSGIKIPIRLENILKPSNLYGPTLTTIENFRGWISNSLTPFFPNYTKHDLVHIQDVLASCDDLIHDDAIPSITASDVAVLIGGCLLHDSALHLTEDGFSQLISEQSPWKPIPPFDNQSWSLAWVEFLGEARRFDGRKLTELFGEPDPISPPPKKIADWTERHRKLIGEFIRRNHTALAHQFACFGLPGKDSLPLPLVALPAPIADLAGLLARSHGHDLREMLPYLEKTITHKTTRELIVFF